MQKKEISIIIPIYNVEKYIKKCLDSILKQAYPHFECLLIEDCSTDNSLEIAREYVGLHPDVFKLICNDNNLGLAHSRDVGFNSSNSNYIVYVDSDDYLADDFLEKMYKIALETDADIVACDFIRVYDSHSDICNRQRRFEENPLMDSFAWGRIYKKSFLLEHYFSPIRMFLEDVPFNIRLLAANPKQVFVRDTCYYYVFRQLSLINETKNLSELQISLKMILDELFVSTKNISYKDYAFILNLFYFLVGKLKYKIDRYKFFICLKKHVGNLPPFAILKPHLKFFTRRQLLDIILTFKSNGLYLLLKNYDY